MNYGRPSIITVGLLITITVVAFAVSFALFFS